MKKTAFIFIALFISAQVWAQTDIPSSGTNTITTDNETIRDPGGSGNYSQNQDGVLTIYPSTAQSFIELAFTEFALEPHASCGYDYLKVYNGNTVGVDLLGTYCGSDLPGTLISTAPDGSLTLHFVSDHNKQYAGFTAIAKAVSGPAQAIEIGTGTSLVNENPFYGLYDYGYSKNMYLQSEINQGAYISSISFNTSVSGTYSVTNQRIYLAHTALDNLDGLTECYLTGSEAYLSNWTLVYDGPVDYTNGWTEIILDTKFDYNNTDNLFVYYENGDGSWTSGGPSFYYTSTSPTVLGEFGYEDGTTTIAPGCPGYAYYTYSRANIRLGYSNCSYNVGTISGTSGINCGENTSLTLSGYDNGAALKWQWRPASNATWVPSANATSQAATHISQYLGEDTQYRVQLSKNGEICYTNSDNNVIPYEISTSNCTNTTVWKGKNSTDWSTASNWTNGKPGGAITEVFIGNEYTNEPLLTDAEENLIIGSLSVQSGAKLNYAVGAPQVPTITDYLVNEGIIAQSEAGWFYLTGAGSTNTISNTGDMTSLIMEVGSGTINAASDLSLNAVLVSSGKLDMGSFDLTTANGAQVSGGELDLGTGAWAITGGNVSISSSGAIDATSSTVTFSGSTEQTISSNGVTLSKVVVNNSNGIKLLDKMTINSTLTLTDGTINTNDNILEITATAADAITGYDNTNFIISTATGPLRRHIGNNTDTYAFPVGQGAGSSNYFRMDMINGSLSGNGFTYLDVHVKTNTETGNNVDSRITASEGGTSMIDMWDKEWMIIPDNEPSSGTFGLRLYTENISGLEDNKFTIFKRADNSTDYADYGNGVSTNTSIPGHNAAGRTVASGYAEKTGFEPPMAGASGAKSNDNLPIELLNFDAVLNDNGSVDITWATASEINNELFTIERSVDGVDFTPIMERDGAGNSNHIIEYAAVDFNPLMGTSYYRLKQTDYDGTYEYSKMAAITINESSSFRVWPNPATDHLKVQMTEEEGTSFLKIYNDEGRLVYEKEMDGAFTQLDIDLSGLDKGLYFITHINKGTLSKTRFVKN